DLEVRARLQREHAERARQPADHLRAQHRAVVVGEDEHDRPLAEVVAELDGGAAFVAEFDIERNSLVEPLFKSDLSQRGRYLRRWCARFSLETGARWGTRHLARLDDARCRGHKGKHKGHKGKSNIPVGQHLCAATETTTDE